MTAVRANDRESYAYSFHGCDVQSTIDLGFGASGSTDDALPHRLTIRRLERVPRFGRSIWRSEGRYAQDEPWARLHRGDEELQIELPRIGALVLDSSGIGVFSHPGAAIIPFLFGRGVGLWLEWRGTPVLHGSSVLVGDRLIGFTGAGGAGKSTLASAMYNHGCASMTDDLLPLYPRDRGYWVYPGIPEVRLWPDSAENLAVRADHVAPVLPEFEKQKYQIEQRFAAEPATLDRIYVLDRSRTVDRVSIDRMTPAQALTHLIATSFSVIQVEVLGLQPSRLAFLAGLVESVPIYFLRYPRDYETLTQVCRQIIADTSGDPTG